MPPAARVGRNKVALKNSPRGLIRVQMKALCTIFTSLLHLFHQIRNRISVWPVLFGIWYPRGIIFRQLSISSYSGLTKPISITLQFRFGERWLLSPRYTFIWFNSSQRGGGLNVVVLKMRQCRVICVNTRTHKLTDMREWVEVHKTSGTGHTNKRRRWCPCLLRSFKTSFGR